MKLCILKQLFTNVLNRQQLISSIFCFKCNQSTCDFSKSICCKFKRMKYLLKTRSLPFFPESDLRKRIRVHLLNAHGLDEAGIDGGGIFREFLNELLKTGFNPNQGFFKTTNEGLLYPNPAAKMLVGDHFTRHYYFLGRMLGKVRIAFLR